MATSKPKGFWGSAPGILTAIAGVIAAIATVVSAFHDEDKSKGAASITQNGTKGSVAIGRDANGANISTK